MRHKPIPIGTKFHRLEVIGLGKPDRHNHIHYLCRCDCGKEVNVIGSGLRRGDNKSCWCWHRDRLFIHGLSHSPEWAIWSAMIHRCTSPNDKQWRNYGARGITVCERWMGKEGFQNFLKDVGKRPSPELTIDRINNDLGYFPGNVRWATQKEQSLNKRPYKRNTNFTCAKSIDITN